MKNKIIRFRNLLERNKIFLEVLTAIVLTSTSIFVSFQANNIATQANIISNTQTGIMKMENTPSLEIRKTQTVIDSSGLDNVSKWTVLNNNSIISNFEIEKEYAYLNIVKRENSTEINIPLMEYINIEGKSTGQNEGSIYEFDNKNCIKNELLTRQGIWDYGFTQIKSYIEISYINVLTKKETKYYQITPLIQEISNREWDSIKNDWSSKSKNVMHLQDIQKNVQKIKNYR
ncbi:hypothetical protein [Flavobacterium piscisymbiosum]|uniref:Uncharacterized protein n=1 Tax=Flavobacterium piscisymbiosum TaxID=2893753 RepID=A0ABS8MH43_9FLAO|nr:hypothetical protein [Flavobacterium sp. F-30]MCC9064813.1 hypothetical protein [Flavobacterium sp. F-30]